MIYDSDSAFTSTSISILSLVSLKFNSKWQINKVSKWIIPFFTHFVNLFKSY